MKIAGLITINCKPVQIRWMAAVAVLIFFYGFLGRADGPLAGDILLVQREGDRLTYSRCNSLQNACLELAGLSIKALEEIKTQIADEPLSSFNTPRFLTAAEVYQQRKSGDFSVVKEAVNRIGPWMIPHAVVVAWSSSLVALRFVLRRPLRRWLAKRVVQRVARRFIQPPAEISKRVLILLPLIGLGSFAYEFYHRSNERQERDKLAERRKLEVLSAVSQLISALDESMPPDSTRSIALPGWLWDALADENG